MRRILVLADTHVPHRARWVPPEVERALEEADGVVHAGDWTGPELLEFVKGLGKPLWAVRGNMDHPEVAKLLPDKLVFEVEGVRIGLTHGWGAPLGITRRVLELFEGEALSLVVHGHTHRQALKREGEVWVLNPGSPTDTLFTRKRGFAWLEVAGGRWEAKLVSL